MDHFRDISNILLQQFLIAIYLNNNFQNINPKYISTLTILMGSEPNSGYIDVSNTCK